ncbi:GNAT family N-acetyltransferase [Microlunatus speluncae]|uniref:GNAT family N-acetyltransferase n=1 Tax=Microlunatus speluncae TaxID=2594267 RepID=UPI00126645AB|nr:GNAT family N-acetyltransferase [Microlunatus speluncae]
MTRTADGPADVHSIRRVADEAELRAVFAFLAPLFAADVGGDGDFRLERLLERFNDDQALMLVAVDADEAFRGAALGFRDGPSGVKLQALAVDPAHRRRGIASRLLGDFEQVATGLGGSSIFLGIERAARAFYEANGYSGRGTVLRKSLTGRALAESPSTRQDRLAALRAARARRLATPVSESEPLNRDR